MKKIALIIFSTTLLNGMAQEEDVTEKLRKHSIGLDIGSAASILLGGEGRNFKTGIQHKYALTPSWKLRNTFTYDSYSSYISRQGDPTEITDSTLTFESNSSSSYGFTFASGIERQFGAKKLKWFIGFDAFIGYQQSNSWTSEYQNLYTFNTGTSGSISSQGYNPDFVGFNTIRTANYLAYGGSMVLGGEWNFARRFSMGTQISLDLIFRTHLKTRTSEYETSFGSTPVESTFETSYTYSGISISPFRLFFNYKF